MVKSYRPYKEVEEEHRQIRLLAYQLVQDELERENIFINIRSVDEDAVLVADGWTYRPDIQDREPAWVWADLRKHYRKRPRRVEAAIWCPDEDGEEILGALVYGDISKGRVNANIAFIEGNPEVLTQIFGQVVAIAGRYLEVHASMLGCKEIGIKNPVENLVGHYKSNGFTQEELSGTVIIRLYKTLTRQEFGEILGREVP